MIALSASILFTYPDQGVLFPNTELSTPIVRTAGIDISYLLQNFACEYADEIFFQVPPIWKSRDSPEQEYAPVHQTGYVLGTGYWNLFRPSSAIETYIQNGEHYVKAVVSSHHKGGTICPVRFSEGT